MKKLLYILSIVLTLNTNTLKSKIVVEKPAPLTFVSRFDTDGLAYGVSIKGNYAYIANGSSGLKIIDISNPSEPVAIGSYDYYYGSGTPQINSANRIQIKDNYAYIATKFTGLQIIDISNPSHPTFASIIGNELSTDNVTVVGNYAYALDFNQVQIINISNPYNPIVLSTYTADSSAHAISISGNYAYLATFNGLEIIDISNPTSPQYVGIHDTGVTLSVKTKDSYAYVTGSFGKNLHILDISTPASPKTIGISPSGFAGSEVSILGKYAFISHLVGKINIIDISNPTSPQYVGTHEMNSGSFVYDIVTVDSYIYVANSSNGLVILKQTDTDNDGIADSIDLDDDNDGINDSDEITLGFNPLNASDGLADYDKDGFCNAMEFKIGTDMNDINSKPIWVPVLTNNITIFVPAKP